MAYEKNFGEKSDWIRSQRCAVLFCTFEGAKIIAAHAKSRGAGGTKADLLPLCWSHHVEQHTAGIKTFQAKYALDLTSLAKDFELRWLEHSGGQE